MPADLVRGAQVWVRAGADEWRSATLRELGESCVVAFDDGSVSTVPAADLLPASFDSPAAFDDLTKLPHLNEPGLLHCLHQRFEKNDIYTSAGESGAWAWTWAWPLCLVSCLPPPAWRAPPGDCTHPSPPPPPPHSAAPPGPVLIAVNPCKHVNLYSADWAAKYSGERPAGRPAGGDAGDAPRCTAGSSQAAGPAHVTQLGHQPKPRPR
jgi:hypothetical protein